VPGLEFGLSSLNRPVVELTMDRARTSMVREEMRRVNAMKSYGNFDRHEILKDRIGT